MKTRVVRFGRCLLLMSALGFALLATGCDTPEPDNMSSRPWNTPKGWEGGVPGMLYDRR